MAKSDLMVAGIEPMIYRVMRQLGQPVGNQHSPGVQPDHPKACPRLSLMKSCSLFPHSNREKISSQLFSQPLHIVDLVNS